MRDAHISIAGRSNRFRVERCSRDRCDPGLTRLLHIRPGRHLPILATNERVHKHLRRLERVWVDSADLFHYHMHLRTTSDSELK